MKRILIFILILIFCLSFIVSCEKEGDPSSSSSEEEDHGTGLIMTESSANYYYRITSHISTTESPHIVIASDENDLVTKLKSLGRIGEEIPRGFSNETFENHYVVIVVNEPLPTARMGYRDVTATENGYTLIVDRYFIWSEVVLTQDGRVSYGQSAIPEQGEVTVINKCDILAIPKSEFDTPPTAESIQIHNVIYNFTK